MVTSKAHVRPEKRAANGFGRRQFLLTMGVFAAGALAGPLSRRAQAAVNLGMQAFTQSGLALGTQTSMTVLHRDAQVAQQAARAAMRELEDIDALMSLYREQSQVCVLNRTGRLDDADPRLLEVLKEAQAMSLRTDGAFDITVQPLWRTFASAKAVGRLPDETEVQAARGMVDWRKLEIVGARVTVGTGMSITLNGIAQGYAADRTMAVLRRHGIEHALVNAGELAAIGRNAEGKPWTVGIQHPRNKDAFVAVASLDGRCMATSGDYATTFTADFMNHHIFDPATGHSPQSLMSASVVCSSACLADALSTAIFVLGPERGLALVESIPGADLLLVRRDGQQIATKGFPVAS